MNADKEICPDNIKNGFTWVVEIEIQIQKADTRVGHSETKR